MDQTTTAADDLAVLFERSRPRLLALSVRLLGSPADAEDVVQNAWLRLARVDADSVQSLDAWLTTVVARLALDAIRSRRVPVDGEDLLDQVTDGESSPEELTLSADDVSVAWKSLAGLTPAERFTFVLHDLFAIPFVEVSEIMGRTPAACRQLASRARRHARSADLDLSNEVQEQHAVVDAFLQASRNGELQALLDLLDPDVQLRADGTVVAMGGDAVVRGADDVAATFAGRAQGANLAVLDGQPGAAWLVNGTAKVVFDFVVKSGRVVAIELVADPDVLHAITIEEG